MRKILIAEDDADLRAVLTQVLSQEYDIIAVQRGNDALESVQRDKPDLLLLDIMLPGMDGLEVCRQLRRAGCDLPIIMMTGAKTDDPDVVAGLSSGADDYMLKEFSSEQLVARIEACLRRCSRRDLLTGYRSEDGWRIDFETQTACCDGSEVRLTGKEFALLEFLIRRKGETIGREELLDRVWGYEKGLKTRTVDTHILSLRKNLEKDPSRPCYILSERGAGYRFV